MQHFTSKATSINSVRLPAVFRKVSFDSSIVFDYGSGKHTEHIAEYIRSNHRAYLPYDPYNLDDTTNTTSLSLVLNAMYTRCPVDIVCSNVLNVIDDDDTVRQIAHNIEEIASVTGGKGYITVYEGNRSGTGRQTGPDQYQRNEPLRNYLRFFRNATIKNGMIVVGQ